MQVYCHGRSTVNIICSGYDSGSYRRCQGLQLRSLLTIVHLSLRGYFSCPAGLALDRGPVVSHCVQLVSHDHRPSRNSRTALHKTLATGRGHSNCFLWLDVLAIASPIQEATKLVSDECY